MALSAGRTVGSDPVALPYEGASAGFGGLPALDERVVPYFDDERAATPSRLRVDGKIDAQFGGVDTYTVPVEGNQLAVDVVRDRAGSTAAAAILGDGAILDAQYLSAGTTRLTGETESVDEAVVQVFSMDDDDGTYALAAVEREQTPYGESPHSLPGRVQAEDYDRGGSGVAYVDTSEQNKGGYRDGGVDIERTADDGGGYNVGWIKPGEWTEYTVDVAPGTYDVALRVASRRGEGRVRVLLDGEPLGEVDVPETGAWQTWQTATISGVVRSATEGSVLRVESLEGGYNLNWIEFVEDKSATAQQSPFGDRARTLPGTVQAEDYDRGGSGVAYADTSEQNKGGYRDGGVDIERTADDGGGYNVGWTESGEWTEYTVDVAAGTYDVALRVASRRGEGRVRVLLDGESLGEVDVPETGGWQTWRTVTIPDVVRGATEGGVLRVESLEGGYNLNWIRFVEVEASSTPTQTPFRGRPWTIPGTIQVEDYDVGGPDVAYADVSERNMGGYRDGGVDVQETGDDGGGYNIGWTNVGEWTEYTVETVTGTYEARLRVASPNGSGRVELTLDGRSLGTVDVPETGGWQSWQTVTVPGLELDAGQGRILRVTSLEGNYNLNWIEFADAARERGGDVTAPTDWNYGSQGYGQGSYGGISG